MNRSGLDYLYVGFALLFSYGLFSLLQYIFIFPISVHSFQFWICLFISVGIFTSVISILEIETLTIISGVALVIIAIVPVGSSILNSSIFHAEEYSKMLTIKESKDTFSKELAFESVDSIPTIDRTMAEKLGSRKLGEVVSLVSQFNVASDFTQVAVNGESKRVSPLEYASFTRWSKNKDLGIPYYVSIDMVSGESELVKLEESIKYSTSDKFGRYINRYIQSKNPTKLIENATFEVDDKGIPYYIAPVYDFSIGLFGGKDVKEVIVVNATNGKMKTYAVKDVPKWVDRVYDSFLVLGQINSAGTLSDGFLNSFTTKANSFTTASGTSDDGYSYFVYNDDLYLYTGITSVASDESNIGYIIVNTRTKEAKKVILPLATEYSAMESAEGSVQEKGYNATFPILVYLEGKAYYSFSLKDDSGLIKMYAFVDANDYQKLGMGADLLTAWNNISGNKQVSTTTDEVESEKEDTELTSISGVVQVINEVVMDGETTYLVILDSGDTIYQLPISTNTSLIQLEVGNTLNLEVSNNKAKTVEIAK